LRWEVVFVDEVVSDELFVFVADELSGFGVAYADEEVLLVDVDILVLVAFDEF
jgi:hypothetical protein